MATAITMTYAVEAIGLSRAVDDEPCRLDAAEELDDGDPADLGRRCTALRARLPHLSVLSKARLTGSAS